MNTNNRSNIYEIKVGLLTFFGLLVLLGLIYFAKGLNLTETTANIVFEFENSGGISSGSPVVVSGVKRGSVTDVLMHNNKVYINATINKFDDLHSDATAIISILEITGGKKIEIIAGTAASRQFNPNTDTIKGTSTSDLSTLITSLSGVTGNLTSIVVKLDNVISSIEKITSDTAAVRDLRNIISNTESATSDLASVLKTNKQTINSTLKDIATLSKELKDAVSNNKPEVEKIISDLTLSIAQINKIIAKAEDSFSIADTLLININSIVSDIKSDNGGIVSKFIYDKNFSSKVDSLINTADTLLKTIKQHGINTNVRLGSRP